MKKRGLGLSIFLLCIALVQYFGFRSDQASDHRHNYLAPMKQSWLKEAQPIPLDAFELVDTQGGPFRPADLKGRWHIVLFGYTHCPDVCPTTLRILAQALDALKQAGQSPVPRALFISVDPERDNLSRLSAYLAEIHKEIVGLTGTESGLRHLLHTLKSDFKIETLQGEISVNHPTPLFLIDPLGRYIGLFTHPQQSVKLKEDIHRALEENPVPTDGR